MGFHSDSAGPLLVSGTRSVTAAWGWAAVSFVVLGTSRTSRLVMIQGFMDLVRNLSTPQSKALQGPSLPKAAGV